MGSYCRILVMAISQAHNKLLRIKDITLHDYISIGRSFDGTVDFSFGINQTKRFQKSRTCIIERLTNSLMMNGTNSGKKIVCANLIESALKILKIVTCFKAFQVVYDAICSSAPREDTTRVGRAGIKRRVSVDISPMRRVNQAIWLITVGSREKAFKNIYPLSECLANELIGASKENNSAYSIKKKEEIERIAKSARH